MIPHRRLWSSSEIGAGSPKGLSTTVSQILVRALCIGPVDTRLALVLLVPCIPDSLKTPFSTQRSTRFFLEVNLSEALAPLDPPVVQL